MIQFDISANQVLRTLLVVLGILIICNLIAIVLTYSVAPDAGYAKLLERYFNFATEANVPTYYNTILIFMVAQTFYLLGKVYNPEHKLVKNYFYMIAIIFVFLSIDELAGIHEWFSYGLPEHLGIGGQGIFRFAWIIPYGLAVVIFGIFSIKFIRALEKTIVVKYVGAGFLYLMGVFVMEALGGWFVDRNDGVETLEYYLFFTTPEETFEMLAMIWVIHTNLVVVIQQEMDNQ